LKLIVLCCFLSITGAQAELVTGVLAGEDESLIKSKSQGEIVKLLVIEGEQVKAGDVLAVIDDEQEVLEHRLAGVEYKTAEKDYLKTKQLKKFVSSEEILQKKNIYLKKKTIFELKSYNLRSTKVVSPISGVVTKQFIKRGEMVGSGEKIFEVINLGKLIIELDIAAKAASKLKQGQRLLFTTELDAKDSFNGMISYIAPVVDKTSGTVRVRLNLPNPRSKQGAYRLKPGTMVNVKLN